MSSFEAAVGRALADAGDRSMRLGDGRVVAWREYGDPAGLPVIALHGTPGSRTKFAMADAQARAVGVRLVCPDRWGYGGSDPPARPRLADYAHDIAALADGLGLSGFSLVGVSGGGPYAAAVAAMLGERVAALALVAPVGPIAGSPAAAHLSAFHTFSFRVLPLLPGAVRLAFGAFRGVLAVAPSAAVAMASARARAVDRRTTRRPDVARSLGATFRLGLARGVTGAVIDMAVFTRPWGVPLHEVCARSRLWIGLQDRNVPISAAKGLAASIPGCAMEELAGAGHFWIIDNIGEVLDWLKVASIGGRSEAARDDFGA